MSELSDLKALMAKISYEFKNIELLKHAIRHRSAGTNNNERLEFLGDSILNCVIAHALFQKFPRLREGELSRLRAKLVCRDSLADIAKAFHIGEYMKLGAGERKSGGQQRASINADAIEAIIGAMYIDAGFDTCHNVITQWFEKKLADKDLREKQKDPKTSLQEYLQSKHMALPSYDVESIKGKAHNQIFTIHCRVEGIDHFTEGKGRNRRTAEQASAETYLTWLKANDE